MDGVCLSEADLPRHQPDYYMDGVCLSEAGMSQILGLSLDQAQFNPLHRKKKLTGKRGAYDNIFATIEAVASGQTQPAELEPAPLTSGELAEAARDEPVDYKEGSIVAPLEDGRPPEPPEGFSIHTNEAGQLYLRRKRVRNLNRLGIGGFNVRVRNVKSKDEEGSDLPPSTPDTPVTTPLEGDKPVKRKAPLKKPKSKISQTFPSYLQEELKILEEVKEKQEKEAELKRLAEAEARALKAKEEADNAATGEAARPEEKAAISAGFRAIC
ncbi:histone-lysine N-methyltransferase 2C-like [Diaphorina citri]|uniref:Histone-lysine N-methyltransferase 2C-like n=1 Tax=Diaphorina citri TaxID=121845 RepID=A0A3Q0J2I4_DIACI|nr:histone-lysine N-methyltransferase 2C-like [Diaphorina citri]